MNIALHYPSHLSANKCWSYVQTALIRGRNPVLVNLYQSPDTLQQLWLVKRLVEGERWRKRRVRRVEAEWVKRHNTSKDGGDGTSDVEVWVVVVAKITVFEAKTVIISSLPTLLSSIYPFIPHTHLTGRQALLADLDMRFMLSIGLKRRSWLSSPRYAFNPSKSWWEGKKMYWIKCSILK